MRTKQVIVVRHDLIKGDHAIKEGEMMAQIAKASLKSLLNLFTITKEETLDGGFLEPGQISYNYNLRFGSNTILDNWFNGESPRVIVSVPGEKELLELFNRLSESDELIPFALITEFPNNICLGIGPYISEEIDRFTKDLPIL